VGLRLGLGSGLEILLLWGFGVRVRVGMYVYICLYQRLGNVTGKITRHPPGRPLAPMDLSFTRRWIQPGLIPSPPTLTICACMCGRVCTCACGVYACVACVCVYMCTRERWARPGVALVDKWYLVLTASTGDSIQLKTILALSVTANPRVKTVGAKCSPKGYGHMVFRWAVTSRGTSQPITLLLLPSAVADMRYTNCHPNPNPDPNLAPYTYPHRHP
jgi:hypothetical protein